MKTPLVIYHGNCQDGFSSAWACWLRYPEWEFYPATHGDPPPDVSGRHVYMLDFSYKQQTIEAMRAQGNTIAIIDHHVTAQAELAYFEENPDRGVNVLFDMEKSGARLTWEYFHAKEDVPELILHVEDRDLWRFALEGTREISAAVFSYPYEFETWSTLAHRCGNARAELVLEGAAIDRRHRRDVRELVKSLRQRMVIGGVEVWVANIPYTMTSDAGHLMCDGGEQFAACYWDTPTGRTFSLRSREGGADVSQIAKLYGGGGHKHAAGYQIPNAPAGHHETESAVQA